MSAILTEDPLLDFQEGVQTTDQLIESALLTALLFDHSPGSRFIEALDAISMEARGEMLATSWFRSAMIGVPGCRETFWFLPDYHRVYHGDYVGDKSAEMVGGLLRALPEQFRLHDLIIDRTKHLARYAGQNHDRGTIQKYLPYFVDTSKRIGSQKINPRPDPTFGNLGFKKYNLSERIIDGKTRLFVDDLPISDEAHSALSMINGMLWHNWSYRISMSLEPFTKWDLFNVFNYIKATQIAFDPRLRTVYPEFLRSTITFGSLNVPSMYEIVSERFLIKPDNPFIVTILLMISAYHGDIGAATSDPLEFLKTSIHFNNELFFSKYPNLRQDLINWRYLDRTRRQTAMEAYIEHHAQHVTNQMQYVFGRIIEVGQIVGCLRNMPEIMDLFSRKHTRGNETIEVMREYQAKTQGKGFFELLQIMEELGIIQRVET